MSITNAGRFWFLFLSFYTSCCSFEQTAPFQATLAQRKIAENTRKNAAQCRRLTAEANLQKLVGKWVRYAHITSYHDYDNKIYINGKLL